MEWEQSTVLQGDETMADSADQSPRSRPLDPLHYLPLELISNIIWWANIEDTETLRRVSKGWKVASEDSNTNQALLRRFPRSYGKCEGTPSELNLIFRRSCTSIL